MEDTKQKGLIAYFANNPRRCQPFDGVHHHHGCGEFSLYSKADVSEH